MLTVTRTFAGEINSAESSVISAVSGTFTYEGSTYKAYDSYIEQVRTYFQEDDVNLSDADAQDIISSVQSSVKEGIDNGYLYKVSGPDGKTVETPSDSKTSDKNSDSSSKKITKKYDIKKSIEKSKIFYSDASDKNKEAVDMVIKNTGFDLSLVIYMIYGLLGVLVLSIIAAIRFNLFAHDDES